MSEGDIRCGNNCILRRLSNGQHYVTTPSEAPPDPVCMSAISTQT